MKKTLIVCKSSHRKSTINWKYSTTMESTISHL